MRRRIAMSKKRASKSARRKESDDKLSAKEWQARHDAACAIVALKYCDMFKFWRDCRYKPCRSARRCAGDARDCLDRRWFSVPYEVGVAAHSQMSAETPPNAGRFLWGAHQRAPHSVGKPNPELRKAKAKHEADSRAKIEAKNGTNTQAKI
jgi:hypothetical protein